MTLPRLSVLVTVPWLSVDAAEALPGGVVVRALLLRRRRNSSAGAGEPRRINRPRGNKIRTLPLNSVFATSMLTIKRARPNIYVGPSGSRRVPLLCQFGASYPSVG